MLPRETDLAKHLSAIWTANRWKDEDRRVLFDLIRAALVERDVYAEHDVAETVAKWMLEHSLSTGHGESLKDLLDELAREISELREVASRARRLVRFFLDQDQEDARQFYPFLDDLRVALKMPNLTDER